MCIERRRRSVHREGLLLLLRTCGDPIVAEVQTLQQFVHLQRCRQGGRAVVSDIVCGHVNVRETAVVVVVGDG